jgi:hypothetical protein
VTSIEKNGQLFIGSKGIANRRARAKQNRERIKAFNTTAQFTDTVVGDTEAAAKIAPESP